VINDPGLYAVISAASRLGERCRVALVRTGAAAAVGDVSARPQDVAVQVQGVATFALLLIPQRLRAGDLGETDVDTADMPRALMPPGSAAAATLPRVLSAVVAGLSLAMEAGIDAGEVVSCQARALKALCAVGLLEHAET
jgi:hypothetical protein